MKKLCSILLCVTLIFSLTSIAAAAEQVKFTIEPQFQNVKDFSEELAAIKKNDLWGYIDKQGQIVIKPQFEEADSFSEGLAAVVKNGKWHYVNKTGKIVIDSVTSKNLGTVGSFKKGRAVIKQGDKYGYIDANGKMVIACKYSSAGTFGSDGLSVVSEYANQSLKYGYIDTAGNEVIQPQFDQAGDFHDGLALVVKHTATEKKTNIYPKTDKWSYIDNTGKVVLALPDVNIPDDIMEYASINSQDNETFSYRISGKNGGTIKELYMAGPFIENLALIRTDINEELDSINFDELSFSVVIKGTDTGSNNLSFINRTGKVAVDPQFGVSPFKHPYSVTKPFSQGLALVSYVDLSQYVRMKEI